MERIKKWTDVTNINTIVTIISIIIGGPSFIIWLKGNITLETLTSVFATLLFMLLLVYIYSNNKIIKKYYDAKEEVKTVRDANEKAIASVYADTNQKVAKLEIDIVNLKDQAAKWQDTAAFRAAESLKWKSDCKMLFNWKQELELTGTNLYSFMSCICIKI